MTGVRAEISITDPSICPLVDLTEDVPGRNEIVARSSAKNDRLVEEFSSPAAGLEEADAPTDVESVFSYGSEHVYRLEREDDTDCPCDCIERYDCPIVDGYVEDGVVHVVFHAPDVETLGDVIGTVRADHGGISVERLLRSTDGGQSNLVVVDRDRLTDRQHEVLETAHEMGYFAHPKEANAGEVAAELDISPSTFSEHLAAAQRKLLDAVLERGGPSPT